jgi:hypothetical protein
MKSRLAAKGKINFYGFDYLPFLLFFAPACLRPESCMYEFTYIALVKASQLSVTSP